MQLDKLVATSRAVAADSKRTRKVRLLAELLRRLRPEETVAGVAYLTGELRQRQIGVGWASLRDRPAPALEPTLSIGAVDVALARIGETTGAGSQARRREQLDALFAAATADEQDFLGRLLVGELRQGAQAGVMTDAIAAAADVPVPAVRRALLLGGDLREVASAALGAGERALDAFALQVGRPLAPMLAQSAESVADALARTAPAAVEAKIDGARIQVHRDHDEIAVFTRSLDDITARVPEVVEAARALPEPVLVLDGEVIALRADGRPQPFQVTASRVGSRSGGTGPPLTPLFFDLFRAGDADLLDVPLADRLERLDAIVPERFRVGRLLTDDAEAAAAFLDETLAAGHEGVVVKSLAAPYAAGRRGAGWVKVKPRHTFDLVVLAVEWGHGRRRGRLSNLHLGARDPAGGGFVMLGKTFKGLTDAMLAWQTERLLSLAIDPVTAKDSWTVPVRLELVVEIAFDGV
ncbi:MAG: ATP-dependent DNA ligase, partial [Mycobacteriales bacterium]